MEPFLSASVLVRVTGHRKHWGLPAYLVIPGPHLLVAHDRARTLALGVLSATRKSQPNDVIGRDTIVDLRRLAVAVLVVLPLLLLAACGGGAAKIASSSIPRTTSSAPTSESGPTSTSIPPSISMFTLQSASFISSQIGWALGEEPCSTGRCFGLLKTSVGGSSWSAATAPPFTMSPASLSFISATIDFATPEDGWAYDSNESQVGGDTGDQLFATHNGGSSWVPITLGNLDKFGMEIQALEAGQSHVWAALFSSANDDFAIVGSPVNEDDWTTAPLTLPLGAGPVAAFQIVLEGDSGWIVDSDRGTMAGASLKNGAWTTWTPPCQDRSYGDAELAGISKYDLVAFCPPNLVVSTPLPAALFTSTNGGESFQDVAATLPSSVSGLVASPSGALFCYDEQGIAGSFNDGRTWQTVLNLGSTSSPVPNTGFDLVTSGVGYALTSAGELMKTVDGGHSWESVAFSSS